MPQVSSLERVWVVRMFRTNVFPVPDVSSLERVWVVRHVEKYIIRLDLIKKEVKKCVK